MSWPLENEGDSNVWTWRFAWSVARSARETPQGKPRSLGEAADYHLAEGGFVDWARLMLRTGDPVRELSEAYAKLFGRVTEAAGGSIAGVRGAAVHRNRIRFCTARADPGRAAVGRGRLTARLAEPGPADRHRRDERCRLPRAAPGPPGHDWIPLNRGGRESMLSAGLATIPSVTEVSRTSLLCGQLRQGSSADEHPVSPHTRAPGPLQERLSAHRLPQIGAPRRRGCRARRGRSGGDRIANRRSSAS